MGVAKILIKNKAQVDLRNQDGENALYVAVTHSYVSLFELLLQTGSHIDSTGKNDMTHLTRAASRQLQDANGCVHPKVT